jgi:hypothetical protein
MSGACQMSFKQKLVDLVLCSEPGKVRPCGVDAHAHPYPYPWHLTLRRVETEQPACEIWECWEANITSLQGTHAYFHNNSGKTLLFLVKKNMGRSHNHSPTAYMVFVSFGECLCSSNSKARYSGHTLSRLAEIRHNRTKQSRFPTTWRESLESRETWSNNSKSSWLSRILNFYWVRVPSVSRDLCKSLKMAEIWNVADHLVSLSNTLCHE